MITPVAIAIACCVLSIAAVVCSVTTIAKGDWRWYLPTVIFATASLALAVYELVAF